MCKLVGIKPINGNEKWPTNHCDDIYDQILDPCSALFARPMKETKSNTSIMQISLYDIVLYDCSKFREIDVNINEMIINENYAEIDPDTRHFMNIVCLSSETAECEVNGCNDSDDEEDEENWDHLDYVQPTFGDTATTLSDNDEHVLDYDICFTDAELAALVI